MSTKSTNVILRFKSAETGEWGDIFPFLSVPAAEKYIDDHWNGKDGFCIHTDTVVFADMHSWTPPGRSQ